jgi:ubiquinol-cytochrome c reductase iron-sulfur subunit
MAEVSRRDLLRATACAVACGIRAPQARAAMVEPTCEVVRFDASDLAPGDFVEVTWCGLPILIWHRTDPEISEARSADITRMRDPERDADRFPDPRWLVVIDQCTHLGCKVLFTRSPQVGWQCVCHGSQYDTSGRILSGPAQRNLDVPPFRVVAAGIIEIGQAAE